MMSAYKSRDIYRCFWSPVEGVPNKHECKICGRKRQQNIRNGYNNLKDHTFSHDVWEETLKRYLRAVCTNGPMDAFVLQPSDKAKTIYEWVEWIVEENLPLNFCEKKLTRNKTSLGKITTKTLKKYMRLLELKLRDMIKDILPPKFGLVMDGWTSDSHHYSAIFATFCDRTNTPNLLLLSCNVQEDIDDNTVFDEDLPDEEKFYGFTAADWFDTIVEVLNKFGVEVNADNVCDIVEFYLGDNCATNRKLATDSGNTVLLV